MKSWIIEIGKTKEKLMGNTLTEAVEEKKRKLALEASLLVQKSHVINVLETSIYYSQAIFGGQGGVVVDFICDCSSCYPKDSKKYEEYKEKYQIWIKANENDI